jgi:hypothetical protein
LEDEGRIKAQLHDRRGTLNGVLLEDGTIVRMPPPEAERLAANLGERGDDVPPRAPPPAPPPKK